MLVKHFNTQKATHSKIRWWASSQLIESDFTWGHIFSFGLQGADGAGGSVHRKGRTFQRQSKASSNKRAGWSCKFTLAQGLTNSHQ